MIRELWNILELIYVIFFMIFNSDMTLTLAFLYVVIDTASFLIGFTAGATVNVRISVAVVIFAKIRRKIIMRLLLRSLCFLSRDMVSKITQRFSHLL